MEVTTGMKGGGGDWAAAQFGFFSQERRASKNVNKCGKFRGKQRDQSGSGREGGASEIGQSSKKKTKRGKERRKNGRKKKGQATRGGDERLKKIWWPRQEKFPHIGPFIEPLTKKKKG